ncbi:G-type lectin S-receptor-like serine/threonine-protein kinase B120 isoform X2 [Rosa rugosa]|uniref:G-type lectin S-receptor-like serine/threonine-protein kinase B120 isoform X2 n=1 Tax=Rosa rugosa TaxID=74645 RepID=UPI002B413B62|nr:G-type lectin S-receptor-like serine/threonine-protein kinase B120 isoform X2 [Rosa rugosa]
MGTKTNPNFMVLVLFLCLYQNTGISLAANTITTNQSLFGDQTIVSAGGDFELGFFRPDNFSNYCIGIWYYKQVVLSEKTIVWVANREQPVSDRFASVLRISDGNLVLFNESRSEVWSTRVTSTTTTSSSGTSIHAVLLDNGNLVLRDGSDSQLLWQSFDHQAQTSLPGSTFGLDTIAKQTPILTSWKNSRRISLQCGNTDKFREMSSMSLPEGKELEYARSIVQCESACINNCSCTAYAYVNSDCSIWSGDLLNLQQLTADDGNGATLYLRLAASEFKNPKSDTGGKRSLVIALLSATAALLITIFGFFLWKKTLGNRRKSGETMSNVNIGGKNDIELPLFGLRSILAATNNFSEANKLGEGGFGPVYKGILTENTEVAIKRLSKKSGQGHQEFMNELKVIVKLQHINLVRLLGCCLEDREMILIYEYMPNRSLDTFLFDPSEKTKLNWSKRFQIIEGIAQGVLYIHKYSRLKIIHRDLKASNVLLDEDLNPKISDFGMAKIIEINQKEANTNRVVGTYGYMSPEYARYGHFSVKLDVFSFGVLLLEIVSGKRNASFYHDEQSVVTLAGWAWQLWKEGKGMEVIDASVRETCEPHEALRCIHVGFLCVQEAPVDRPTMSSVIDMLQGGEATFLPPSKPPAFSTHRKSDAVVSSSQTPTRFSNNAITISIPEGR